MDKLEDNYVKWFKKIFKKDGRPNPFKDNCPGKDWWYTFLACGNLTACCSVCNVQESEDADDVLWIQCDNE